MEKKKIFLPVSLDITDKAILLVGGGKVALEKITSLRRFTSNIVIVTIDADEVVKDSGIEITYKEYEKSDLDGFFLVYACTNNSLKNREVKADCIEKGILVNVVDNPKLCDFVSPAIFKEGNMTVAVGSNGENVRKSIQWRNKIKEVLEYGTSEL